MIVPCVLVLPFLSKLYHMTSPEHGIVFNGTFAHPTNSLSCFPDDAVTAISFINLRKPFAPLTSKNLFIFSPIVSAGSKSQTSMMSVSSLGFSEIGLRTEVKIKLQMEFELIELTARNVLRISGSGSQTLLSLCIVCWALMQYKVSQKGLLSR